MSEMITPEYTRQLPDVTRDIRIKTGQFLLDAIEIGRLLFEAKAMVEPGGWSKYIEEELPFSHSWANNYMRLYKELGGEQISLFGNSQALANLRPTQALELLALPAQEREEFVENHDVGNMSTRQLHRAVQEELDKTRQELEETRNALAEADSEFVDLREDLARAENAADTARQEADTYLRQKKAADQAKDNAERNLQSARTELEKIRKQLAEAQEQEKVAKEALEEARNNPDVPESVMEQMRQEMAAEAAEKAAKEAEDKLAAAWKEVDKATAAKEIAEKAAAEAEAALTEAQKQIKLANPDIAAYNALMQQFMKDYEQINERRKAVAAGNPDAGEGLRKFQIAVLSQWLTDLQSI